MSNTARLLGRRVQGTPIHVYDRTLTPVVRVVSMVRRRGTIGQHSVEGVGGGFVCVRPVGVVERRNGETREVPIADVTGSMLRQMALVATAIPLVALALISFSRWIRGRQDTC